MKQRTTIFALFLFLFLGACGASDTAQQPAAQWQTVTAAAAYDRMTSGDPVTVVDVRTAEEYAEKHIPGAILLPNDDISDTQPALLPDLDAEILVYCRSGRRSALAAEKLAGLGYTNISDFGGINDWPYDTEAGAWDAS